MRGRCAAERWQAPRFEHGASSSAFPRIRAEGGSQDARRHRKPQTRMGPSFCEKKRTDRDNLDSPETPTRDSALTGPSTRGFGAGRSFRVLRARWGRSAQDRPTKHSGFAREPFEGVRARRARLDRGLRATGLRPAGPIPGFWIQRVGRCAHPARAWGKC